MWPNEVESGVASRRRDLMPRVNQTRPAGSISATAPDAFGPRQQLVSLLAQSAGPSDLLPRLHHHALEATGGVCSLLFRYNPRNGLLHATSGFGLDALGSEPWTPDKDEAALIANAFDTAAPVFVADADRLMPDLSSRLGTPATLLLPLVRRSAKVGLLAIGFTESHSRPPADTAGLPDAFVASLELFELRQREELQRDLMGLLDEFSTSLSATLNLATGLGILCHGANRLFGADRTSVWIHDRRARELVLQASSDAEQIERGVRVDAADASAPAAVAMRRLRAEIVSTDEDGAIAMVTVPLRGRRRALGTIVFESARIEPGGELDVLDRADELGRQLSAAIENIQLLDEVIRSRRELENTFDSISHLVAVVDRRGRIVHANKAFAVRVGRAREELVDRAIAELVGPELAAWLERQQAGPADTQPDTAPTCEVVDPRLNGPFLVTVTDLLDQEHQSVGSVIVARDLQTQTRLEGEREELRKRLTQTEKLAALGQFVAGIAHELNNPLQGVLGHLELLRATGAFPKQLRKEVQTIYREADRAAKIVRNLLIFAGSRRLVRRAVSVNGVLQKVFTLRASAHRAAGIEVVRHYDEQLPRVASDPLLLHQVFLNMVMNAEHAIAATGRIEVTTSVVRSRDRIVVELRDTGTGIPDDTLPRIFEPFYTTKDVGKGTGLGLAIAYGIIQEHGGHISAANHPNGGAVFTVELPTARPAGR